MVEEKVIKRYQEEAARCRAMSMTVPTANMLTLWESLADGYEALADNLERLQLEGCRDQRVGRRQVIVLGVAESSDNFSHSPMLFNPDIRTQTPAGAGRETASPTGPGLGR